MSQRQKDIDDIQTKIAKLQTEQQEIAQKYQTYHGEVQEKITGLLKGAGIFEKVNELENGRQQVQQEAQQKGMALQQQVQDLMKMRAYLLERQQEDGPAEDEDEDEDNGDTKKDDAEPEAEEAADDDEEAPKDGDVAEADAPDDGDKPEKPQF